MKTEAMDFVLSTLALTLLAVLSAGVAWGVSGLCEPLLGAYHVLVGAAAALLVFGLAAAFLCGLIVKAGLVRPGRYPMGDPLFRWWKLFTVLHEFGRGSLKPFTTVFAVPLVAKLFGAQIGRDIALGGHVVDPQFISIGDEAIVGQDSVVTAHTIVSGTLILAPVFIGARATVGVHAVVMSGVRIGEDAVVAAGAVVPPDTEIPPGELWGGVPARRIKSAAELAAAG